VTDDPSPAAVMRHPSRQFPMSYVALAWSAEPVASDSLANLIEQQIARRVETRLWEAQPGLRRPARATAWRAVAEGLLKMTADMALCEASGARLLAPTVTPAALKRQLEPA